MVNKKYRQLGFKPGMRFHGAKADINARTVLLPKDKAVRCMMRHTADGLIFRRTQESR